MRRLFRIHGDNIVECERIVNTIIDGLDHFSYKTSLLWPSTIKINLEFEYQGENYDWELHLLPGFNKAGRFRWSNDIFDALKANGSFLDETPDAIITSVNNNNEETILLAIEYCSALQAGNQAWQRSGRAYSTGVAGCPYLYVVDFVKYELDSETRERKALRFPNPIVPYSYVSFSKESGIFSAQAYLKSEEFNEVDKNLQNFDDSNFASNDISEYLLRKMIGLETDAIERKITAKNMSFVSFLASSSNSSTSFSSEQWEQLYSSNKNIYDYSIKNSSFSFQKTVTSKGMHGKIAQLLKVIQKYSTGVASSNLPFGVIPKDNIKPFVGDISSFYSVDDKLAKKILAVKDFLVVCVLKGFKPGGDDNRPDRGVLPLVSMLSPKKVDILTVLYGPILENNFNLLINNPDRLAENNGLWKTVLRISDYVLIDSPLISSSKKIISTREYFFDNTQNTVDLLSNQKNNHTPLTRQMFPSSIKEYHEDDVDTAIHYFFSHVLSSQVSFEGMCNPPGGDWSGMSIMQKDGDIARWLSLPRVSGDIAGKRPDHVIELFSVFEKPLLLSIESKEKSQSLEPQVGRGLKNYIKYLMSFVPSAVFHGGYWNINTEKLKYSDYECLSVAAFIDDSQEDDGDIFDKTDCDLIFRMITTQKGWRISIATNSDKAKILKNYLVTNSSEEIVFE